MRTFKIYSPGKFPVHNTVLLTLVSLLCIRSPELILKWKSCALGHISLHFSHTLTPGNHYSTLFLQVWIFQIPHISGIMQYLSFSIWLISLSILTPRFVHIVTNGRTSLCKLEKIIFNCLYVPHFLYPSVCQWKH